MMSPLPLTTRATREKYLCCCCYLTVMWQERQQGLHMQTTHNSKMQHSKTYKRQQNEFIACWDTPTANQLWATSTTTVIFTSINSKIEQYRENMWRSTHQDCSVRQQLLEQPQTKFVEFEEHWALRREQSWGDACAWEKHSPRPKLPKLLNPPGILPPGDDDACCNNWKTKRHAQPQKSYMIRHSTKAVLVTRDAWTS